MMRTAHTSIDIPSPGLGFAPTQVGWCTPRRVVAGVGCLSRRLGLLVSDTCLGRLSAILAWGSVRHRMQRPAAGPSRGHGVAFSPGLDAMAGSAAGSTVRGPMSLVLRPHGCMCWLGRPLPKLCRASDVAMVIAPPNRHGVVSPVMSGMCFRMPDLSPAVVFGCCGYRSVARPVWASMTRLVGGGVLASCWFAIACVVPLSPGHGPKSWTRAHCVFMSLSPGRMATPRAIFVSRLY